MADPLPDLPDAVAAPARRGRLPLIWLVPLVASGYAPEKQALTLSMLRWLTPICLLATLPPMLAALLHAEPDRFALVYRILWRLRDEPGLLALASDRDMSRLAGLAKAGGRGVQALVAHTLILARGLTPRRRRARRRWRPPQSRCAARTAPG